MMVKPRVVAPSTVTTVSDTVDGLLAVLETVSHLRARGALRRAAVADIPLVTRADRGRRHDRRPKHHDSGVS